MSLRPTRRQVMATAIVAGAPPLLPRRRRRRGSDMRAGRCPSPSTSLRDMARDLAEQPCAEPRCPTPTLLETIDYDLHNQITYRPDAHALGRRAGRGQGALLPSRGATSRSRSRSACSTDGKARELMFSTDLFDMPADHPARKLTQARASPASR